MADDNVVHLHGNMGTAQGTANATTATAPLSQMLEDLQKSGLIPADIGTRVMENVERAATNTGNHINGYVIPYTNIYGQPVPHYRVRLFNSDVRYRQPKDAPNHIFFPRGFIQMARDRRVILLTEGEKKAALAAKLGFAAAGLGGVDAWRNRILSIPGNATLSQKPGQNGKVGKLQAKLASGDEINEDEMTALAIGLQDLIDLSLELDATVVIVFDSDKMTGIKASVQRAAATLGYELRSKGIPFQKIRQLILPFDLEDIDPQATKLGLDDYLLHDGGMEHFNYHLRVTLEKRSAFPRHPSVVDYVSKRLQKSRLSRKEQTHIAIAILSELDSLGMRLRSPDEDQMYYFDYRSRTLMKAYFLVGLKDEAHDTPFGALLYRRFGISAADQRVLVWLSAQFSGEDPISDVSPQRVYARPSPSTPQEDCVRYQINDAEYVEVTADGITIRDNGYGGVLFEAGHVQPVDKEALKREYLKQVAQNRNKPTGVSNWWSEVLQDVRLRDHDKGQKFMSLLYYISPWLNRWRGTQLPIELILGESGSGKSTLCEFRLHIITGEPRLRNSPRDIKDWYASISNTGGLHVTDNVQMLDKNLRNSISDELCRLVTEPNPTIEARKLYSNNELIRVPVRTCFALTAIKQPFQNADLIQRSVILELDKPHDPNQNVLYDMSWAQNHLDEYGGRAAWIAHHLYVLQRFFQLVKQEWNPRFPARHRLINMEQSLLFMAKVFNLETEWLPDYLTGFVDRNLASADWAFEGIAEFVRLWKEGNPNWKERGGVLGPYFFAGNITQFAESHEDFRQCEILISTRRLGRYMQEHKSMLAAILGIVQSGESNNRARYRLAVIKGKGDQ